MECLFDAVKANRISENIVDQIRRAILKGELKVGDRLPSEKELAKSFGVSKASLREAYRALEAYGLLEIKQGMSGGAFIKRVDLKTIKDGLVNYFFFQNHSIHEYTQLRKFIEPEVVKICAYKVKDCDIDYLENNISEMEKEPNGENFISDLDCAFHKKLVDITENRVISLIIESTQMALINVKRMLHLDQKFLKMVCEGHKSIVDALKERDPEKASKVMLRHIFEVEAGMLASRSGGMVLTETGVLKPDSE